MGSKFLQMMIVMYMNVKSILECFYEGIIHNHDQMGQHCENVINTPTSTSNTSINDSPSLSNVLESSINGAGQFFPLF